VDIFIKLFWLFIPVIFVMAFVVRVGQRSVVYVAVVADDNDPNAPKVIGAYYKEDKAQARVYQYSRETRSIVYSDVVKCQINPKRG
jgi:hypothetical protein